MSGDLEAPGEPHELKQSVAGGNVDKDLQRGRLLLNPHLLLEYRGLTVIGRPVYDVAISFWC